MLKKLWATKKIYDIIVRAIDERERSGSSKPDTLQMLFDEHDERTVMVGVSFPVECGVPASDVSTVHFGSAGRWRESDWDNRVVAHHVSW